MVNKIELNFIRELINDNMLYYKTKVKQIHLNDILAKILFSEIGKALTTSGGFIPFKHIGDFINNKNKMDKYKNFKYPLDIKEVSDVIDYLESVKEDIKVEILEKAILNDHKREEFINISSEMLHLSSEKDCKINELLRKYSYKLDQLKFDSDDSLEFHSMNELAEQELKYQDSDEIDALSPMGWNILDDEIGGIPRPSTNYILAPPKLGKMETLSSLLYTPEGVTTMGEIKVGDYVFDEKGKPNKVLKIHEHEGKIIYRVYFNDGNYVDCGKEHLWRVQRCNNRKDKRVADIWNTLNVGQMLKEGIETKGKNPRAKFYIPLTEPVEFNERRITIDPYVLGVILGDGSIGDGITITNSEEPIVNKLREYEHFSSCKWNDNKNTNTIYLTRKVKHLLDEYNLTNLKSDTKFIPKDYLFNSIENRLQILRGLFDTDGCVEDGKTLVYYSTSKEMANNVKFLVESLGGVARLSVKKSPKYKYKGEIRIGKDCYKVVIQISNDIKIWSTPKHEGRFKGRKKPLFRNITKIEERGIEPARCIEVESESHLYLTNNFIVTHNSTSLYDLSNKGIRSGKNILFVTIEIPTKEATRKMYANYTKLNYKDIIGKSLSDSDKKHYRDSINNLSEKYNQNFYMIYNKDGVDVKQIEGYVSNLKKSGIEIDTIFIDYLTLLNSVNDKKKSDVEKFMALPKELRVLSQNTNTAIISAGQLDVSTIKKKIEDITLEDMHYVKNALSQEATNVFFLNSDDESKNSNGKNHLKIKHLLGRNGINDLIYSFEDYDYSKVYLGEDTEFVGGF